MTSEDMSKDQLELARRAARGDQEAREQVNNLAHPLIDYHTNRFCQRFCDQNRFLYRCSLSRPVGNASADALLCEWGNASYGWMLDDLTRPERLNKYEARNKAGLFDYLYQIANSLPFYERWKDWRFGRKINVPTYIQSIAPLAKKVFFALRAGHELEMIAAQVNATLSQVESLSHRIVASLSRHNRLYLLDPPREQSLTSCANEDHGGASQQQDIAFIDDTALQQDEANHLNGAWQQLDTVEQFVLEALIVNEMSAQSVLQALRTMDVSIKTGLAAEDTSIQQLYYFKRKTLNKVAKLLGTEKNDDQN